MVRVAPRTAEWFAGGLRKWVSKERSVGGYRRDPLGQGAGAPGPRTEGETRGNERVPTPASLASATCATADCTTSPARRPVAVPPLRLARIAAPATTGWAGSYCFCSPMVPDLSPSAADVPTQPRSAGAPRVLGLSRSSELYLEWWVRRSVTMAAAEGRRSSSSSTTPAARRRCRPPAVPSRRSCLLGRAPLAVPAPMPASASSCDRGCIQVARRPGMRRSAMRLCQAPPLDRGRLKHS